MSNNSSGAVETPRSSDKKIIIATNNEGKIKEFKKLFVPLGIKVISMKEAGLDLNIVEDGETFEENAHIKARAVFEMTGLPTIADDSGLEIDFLDGAPGIYSARYAGEGATDEDRYIKVLEEMAGVDLPLRTARFVCAIYFIVDEDVEHSITGTVDGYIAHEPKGKGGFGYDPIFMIDEHNSMAELNDDEKNKISHRARAFEKLSKILADGEGIPNADK